jgi:hypothetical protein
MTEMIHPMRRVLLAGAACCVLAGCFVTGPVPEGVVVEPPAYRWHWWAVPHYEVEHRYVVEETPVVIQHQHYYPFYDRVHPPVREIDKHRKQRDEHRRDHD